MVIFPIGIVSHQCLILLQCENSFFFNFFFWKNVKLYWVNRNVTSYDSENDSQSKPLSRKALALFVDRLLLQVLSCNKNYTLVVKISQSVK